MNLPRYYFGYLFVRGAKGLALLALLTTFLGFWYRAAEYEFERHKLRYVRSDTLALELRALSDELSFAQGQTARFGELAGPVSPSFGEAPEDSAGFEELRRGLHAVSERRDRLKAQVLARFREKTEALRARIRTTIAEIEQVRAEAQPAPKASAQPPSAPTPANSFAGPVQNVFADLSGNEIENMRRTLDRVSQFLDGLGRKAEKEESRRLLTEARSSLEDIVDWLPTPLPTRERFDVDPGLIAPRRTPADPLTAAMENERSINDAFDAVQAQIYHPWRLDAALLQATRTVDAEYSLCRGSENALHALRLERAWNVALLVVGGVTLAFFILVFADFIQSFFDTASNSEAIRHRLENE